MENYREDIKHIYTQDEIDLILNRLRDNETFTCAFLTSCYTGMRTGEVFALSWNDIDLNNGIISIKHSIYDKPKDEKGRWYIGRTKTPTGTRNIHISNTLLMALKNYKKKQQYWKRIFGNEYKNYHLENVENEFGKVKERRIVENDYGISSINDINLVFTKEDGSYVGTDLLRAPYKIIHNELGLKKCRFYDLRGSYATKILRSGVEIKDVAEMLGHKNIETTENYYISSDNDAKKIASELFERATFSDTINEIVNYKI
ncbi:MAG: site-specific integrase [Clostridia bacterium]|nr:site-specific integrase [Clostridia bacterium]